MIYATKDAGSAIGEILGAITTNRVGEIEICLTQDSLVTTVRMSGAYKRIVKPFRNAVAPAVVAEKKTKKNKSQKKGKRASNNGPEMFECGGVTLSAKDWAKKIHVSENCVRYRIRRHGNPYGLTGPTDKDKIIAGS